MELRKADLTEFEAVRQFYWELIDLMFDQRESIGWKKGIYPSDDYLKESLKNHELYLLELSGRIAAAVIVNSRYNEGYTGLPWKIECPNDEVYIPHALGVHPRVQGQGIGKAVVRDIILLAKENNKKTIRLDILAANKAAEKLYTAMGFEFVAAKNMYYDDTGWTEYKMYELML